DRLPEPPRDLPAADHALRRHARSRRGGPPARAVGIDQRRGRRDDEADRGARGARAPARSARRRSGGRGRHAPGADRRVAAGGGARHARAGVARPIHLIRAAVVGGIIAVAFNPEATEIGVNVSAVRFSLVAGVLALGSLIWMVAAFLIRVARGFKAYPGDRV